MSSLELVVPETELVGQASPGLAFRVTETEGKSVFRFDGVESKFAFQWRPRRAETQQTSAAFEVESQLDIQVESTGSLTTDAQLSISALHLPLESVRIRLPRDARWSETGGDAEAYSIERVGMADGRQELEVVFVTPSKDPPTIRLEVETANADNKEGVTYELAGFDVLEATSQFGQVNLYTVGDHRLVWNTGEFAQRTSAASGARASFLYYQPHQIQMTVSRQPREVMVEPLYVLDVSEDEVTLNAVYRCNTGGAMVSDLTVDLGDWKFAGLGKDPQNLIGDQAELRPVDGKITLPARNTPNEFEIAIIATLAIDEIDLIAADANVLAATRLQLDLPKPEGVETILPSTVAVVSDPDIVLTPQLESSSYSTISVPPEVLEEVDEEANPLCFRMRSSGSPAPLLFAAARLERIITIHCDTDVIEVGTESLRIQQRMRWEVDEVQLPRALLTIPKRVYQFGNPQVSIDGKPTFHSRYVTFGDSELDRYTVQVELDRLIGSFELTVTYDWENSEATMNEVLVDLVLPTRDTSAVLAERMHYTNRLRRPRVQGYQISLSAAGNAAMNFGWIGSSDLAALDAEIEARSDKLLPQLPLSITQVSPDVVSTTFEELVEQSWYQTWYTDAERTDRAVFRVRGADKTLRIVLPEDTNFRKLHAWIDGKKVEFLREGVATIELNVSESSLYHVVELRYARDRRSPPGVLETRVPVIEGADMIGQWYWHLVMPSNESLVSWPRSLTRAHQWDWSSWMPRVRPQLGQTQLENWSGAMRVKSNVLLGSNEYLFGAIGEPDTLWVRTTPLPIYVVVIAGSILVFGLMLLQARRQQRLSMLCVAGCIIAAVIYVHPSYGAIGGQVVVLGTSLVVLASGLKWLYRGASRRTVSRRMPRSTRIMPRSDSGRELQPTLGTSLPSTTAGVGTE